MKRRFFRASFLVLVLTMFFFTLTPAAWSASDKPIQLLYGSFDPPKNFFSEVWANFAKELSERSNGRAEVKFNWFCAKPGEFFQLSKKGIVDFGWALPSVNPGMFDLSEIVELPWIFPSCEIASKAINAYFEKGYVDKRYEEVKVLWVGAMNSDYILLGKKPVKTMDDFKGMKICAAGPIMAQRVKMMGGVPTFVPFPEQYSAMKKGIVDGSVMGFPLMINFRLYDVSKNALAPPMGTGMYAITLNKKKWNSLPSDIQAILVDMGKKNVIHFARAWDSACVRGEKLFHEKGGKIHKLEGRELEKAFKMVQPIWQDWITKKEKKGLPGKKAVEDMYAILKDLGIENPAIGYTPGK